MKASFVITVTVRDEAHLRGLTAALQTDLENWRSHAQKTADAIPADGWHRVTPQRHNLWRDGLHVGSVIVGRLVTAWLHDTETGADRSKAVTSLADGIKYVERNT